MLYIVSIQVFSIILLIGDFFYAIIRFPVSSKSYRKRFLGRPEDAKRPNVYSHDMNLIEE